MKKTNLKYFLNIGDTIELEVSSKQGIAYRIEEKKYCPVSGGLYTVEQTSDIALSNRRYTKTFDEYGMSFLFRFTDKNQLHDITTCVINTKYKVQFESIKITGNNIQPNIISIEQNDWLHFEWDTEREETSIQIEQLYIDENKQQPIEVCISYKNTKNEIFVY